MTTPPKWSFATGDTDPPDDNAHASADDARTDTPSETSTTSETLETPDDSAALPTSQIDQITLSFDGVVGAHAAQPMNIRGQTAWSAHGPFGPFHRAGHFGWHGGAGSGMVVQYQVFLPGHREHVIGRAYLSASLDAVRRYILRLWHLVDDSEIQYTLWGLPDLALAAETQRLSSIAFGQRYGHRLVDLTNCVTMARACEIMRVATYANASPDWLAFTLLRTPTGLPQPDAHGESRYRIDDIIQYAEELIDYDASKDDYPHPLE